MRYHDDRERFIPLDVLDPDGFVRLSAATVVDFNGDLLVHVFVNGERIARMDPASDWEFHLIRPYDTREREVWVEFMYHAGELSEDDYLAWADSDLGEEAFDRLSELTDGHGMIAVLGCIAHEIHQMFPDSLPEPTGF